VRSKPLLPSILLVAALAIAAAFAGCGDGDVDAERGTDRVRVPTKAYRELLVGLRKAALAGNSYQAVRRAKPLAGPEEAAIVAFCEIAWKVDVNQEGDPTKGPPIVPWVRNYAAAGLGLAHLGGGARLPALSAALAELNSTLHPASLTGKLSNRYKRACYT
jgi:hypothetical protein